MSDLARARVHRMGRRMSRWTPDLLHEHLTALRAADLRFYDERQRCHEELRAERQRVDDVRYDEMESRFKTLAGSIEDLQTRWSARFSEHGSAQAAQIGAVTRQLELLGKIVYVGLGLVLAAQFVIPLLHR